MVYFVWNWYLSCTWLKIGSCINTNITTTLWYVNNSVDSDSMLTFPEKNKVNCKCCRTVQGAFGKKTASGGTQSRTALLNLISDMTNYIFLSLTQFYTIAIILDTVCPKCSSCPWIHMAVASTDKECAAALIIVHDCWGVCSDQTEWQGAFHYEFLALAIHRYLF